MNLQDILPKQDDAQRLLALNGVPKPFWLSAEEINLILKVLAALLGQESALYKGEYPSLAHVEAAHPLPEPGSEAQIIVVDGDNLKASWDNTNKKWFLDGLYVQPGSDAAYLLKSLYDTNGNGIIDKAEHIHSVLTAGGTKYYGTRNGIVGVFDLPTGTGGGGSTETLPSGFKVENFSNGYQGGLNWKPFAKYSFDSNSFSVSANITIDTSTIPAGQKRLAALVLNSNGAITLVEGEASVNPSAPNIDPATQMIPDGGLIFLSSGAAAPDGISLNRIYTNNSGIAGGEFVASILFGGARWNLASNAGDGICIKGTELLANDQIRFLPEAAIPIGQFTELVFKIQNLVLTGLTSGGGGFRFVVYGNYVDNRGRVRNSNVLLPSFDAGGYDLTSLAEQFISLKVSALPFYEITELRFVFDHTDPAVVPTILLDEIKYNDGSAPPGENFATVGYVDRKAAETLQAAKDYADNLVVVGSDGNDNVHDSYDFMNDMYADQDNQIDGEHFIVVDASAHPTVDSGWAMFEFLGAAFGDHQDYRKLSEQESLDVINPPDEVTQAELDALAARVQTLENNSSGAAETTSGILTTSTSITSATLTDAGKTQSGKVLRIANGVNAINYTVNGITASFIKGGTGAITFVQGAGRTLTGANGTLVFNGAVNSTASIVSFGTTDILYINNL